MKQITPTKNSISKFQYFSSCQDSLSDRKIPVDETGYSAEECFHAYETYGELPPCREPELLNRAFNGKKRHGVLVDNCGQDYYDRQLFARELKQNYPEWVRVEILKRASQISLAELGFIPEFIETGEDFTTINLKEFLKTRKSL